MDKITDLIPDFALDDIRSLLALDEKDLDIIGQVSSSLDAFTSDVPVAERVAKEAGMDPDRARRVLRAAKNLRQICEGVGVPGENLVNTLASELGVDIDEAQEKALARVLSPTEESYVIDKAQRLRRAMVPHLVSAQTVCEIRPVFDKSRERLRGALSIVLLELNWHDTDHNNHSLVLQLDRSDINRLRTTLDKAEKKLDEVEGSLGDHLRFFKQE